MGEQATHGLSTTALSIAGINISAGAGKGSLIKVTPRGDWRTVTVGGQGDVCVNENADHSADFELTLMQSATINRALQAILNLKTVQDGSVGIGPFQLTMLGSGSSISGDCVLVSPPEWDVQAEVQDCTWKGVILEAEYSLGGTT